jgi:hypothetical protein
MFKELKYNLEMIFRSLTFYLETALAIGVVTFMLFGLLKDKELLQMSYLDFFISRIFLITALGFILFYILFIFQDTVLLEKTSGRVELLLSNGFKPQSYWRGSIIATLIVTEIIMTLIFCDFCVFRLFFFPKVPIIGLIRSLPPLSFFNIGVSSLSCALVLRIRRVEIARSVLFMLPFLVFFSASLTTKIQPKYQSTLLLAVFAIGVLLFALGVLIAKKIDSETIALTIPG